MFSIDYNFQEFTSALLFSYSYNSAVVSSAVMMQGIASGILGAYLLYRRKALLADALSHASLPGVGLGFLVAHFFLGGTREEWVIIAGAFVTIFICLIFINFLTRHIKQDAALALSLSSFYGLGIVLLSYIQSIPSGAKAGLETFILGQSATINLAEAQLIGLGALVVVLMCVLFYKELQLLCFDEIFALSQGYRVRLLDFVITLLAVIVIAIGMKAMGLILIMGLLTIPPLTSALIFKNWHTFLISSATIGGLSCHLGAAISTGLEGIPTGVSIILVCAFFYIIGLLWSFNKNVIHRFLAN